MELGINLNYVCRDDGKIPLETVVEKAKYCYDLGYTSFDFLPYYMGENYMDRAKEFRARMDEAGLSVHQSHAPFNRYNKARSVEEFKPMVARAIETAGIVGAKYIVVHADEYRLREGEEYDTKTVHDWTYDYLAPFVDLAEKCGVEIAIEDLFEEKGNKAPRSRHCSTVEELIALIERFDKKISCCWDFGHGQVSFGKDRVFEEFKKACPYISCTHVHDNYYNKDLHLLPYFGDIDWTAHLQYMKENGYRGNFTYEFVYGKMPAPILHEYLLFAKKVADHLFAL